MDCIQSWNSTMNKIEWYINHSTKEARCPSNGVSTIAWVWTGNTESPVITWGGQGLKPAKMIFESALERGEGIFKKT